MMMNFGFKMMNFVLKMLLCRVKYARLQTGDQLLLGAMGAEGSIHKVIQAHYKS